MTAAERFPRVVPHELTETGRRVRDEILSGPRRSIPGQPSIEAEDGSLVGPFGVFLFSPAIGSPLQQLGAALRSESALSARERELATLAVASELGSEFELEAHLPLARAAGVSEPDIHAVLTRDSLTAANEQALVEFCRANAADVAPQAAFDRVCEHYDRQQCFEITALVAYYRGLASMLALFRIALPSESARVNG